MQSVILCVYKYCIESLSKDIDLEHSSNPTEYVLEMLLERYDMNGVIDKETTLKEDEYFFHAHFKEEEDIRGC